MHDNGGPERAWYLKQKKERKEERKKQKNVFKFSNLVKGINLQIQETQQNSGKISLTKPKLRYIIMKLLKTKDKEKFLKSVWEMMHYT